jgi:hypothetical protein
VQSSYVTVIGAEKGAGSDGAIPAFAGRDTPQAGWSGGNVRGDCWMLIAGLARSPLSAVSAQPSRRRRQHTRRCFH